MRRQAFVAALLSMSFGVSVLAFGQNPPPPPPPAPAAAKPVFVAPVRGVADVETLKPEVRRTGGNIVTTMKLKNVSKGAINLLKIEEFWYDRTGKMYPGELQVWKKPFPPGAIIEIVFKVPDNPALYQSQYSATHANGKVTLKRVAKFTESPGG
jgi:hypothetical protein